MNENSFLLFHDIYLLLYALELPWFIQKFLNSTSAILPSPDVVNPVKISLYLIMRTLPILYIVCFSVIFIQVISASSFPLCSVSKERIVTDNKNDWSLFLGFFANIFFDRSACIAENLFDVSISRNL